MNWKSAKALPGRLLRKDLTFVRGYIGEVLEVFFWTYL